MKKILFLLLLIPYISYAQPDLPYVKNIRLSGKLTFSPQSKDSAEIKLKKDSLQITTLKPFITTNKRLKMQGDSVASLKEVRNYVASHGGSGSTDLSKLVTKYDLANGNELGGFVHLHAGNSSTQLWITIDTTDASYQFHILRNGQNDLLIFSHDNGISYISNGVGKFQMDSSGYASFTKNIVANAVSNNDGAVTGWSDLAGAYAIRGFSTEGTPGYFDVYATNDSALLICAKSEVKKFVVTNGGQIKASQYSGSLTDNTPTAAEINAIIGTAASKGVGFQATIKDTDGTGLLYKVESDGTSWYVIIMNHAI